MWHAAVPRIYKTEMYVFHPYSWHYSFSTEGQLRKRNFVIYCTVKQWCTNFPNILGANSNFLAPEGRYKAPTNSSRPCCTKCIHPGDPLSGDLYIPAFTHCGSSGFKYWLGCRLSSLRVFLRIHPIEPKNSIKIIPQLLHSMHFQIRFSLIIFPFDIIQPPLRALLLSTQLVNMTDKQTSVPT
jgi:hypothetical protein